MITVHFFTLVLHQMTSADMKVHWLPSSREIVLEYTLKCACEAAAKTWLCRARFLYSHVYVVVYSVGIQSDRTLN